MDASLQGHQRLRHIPQLDGLRGLAILLVISYHYFGFLKIFSFGWSGVDLFFVLSGFLITGKLLQTSNQKDYFKKFYQHRALRILPLYYAFLIVFFLILFLFVKMGYKIPNYYQQHGLSFFIFLQNWTFVFHGLPREKYLQHFWTLAVEEQFYLFWPIVIYFFHDKKKLLNVLLSIILLVILIRSIVFIASPGMITQSNHYCNSFYRLDSFAMGGLISLVFYFQFKIPMRIVNFFLLVSLLVTWAGFMIFGGKRFENPFFLTIGSSLLAFAFALLLYKVVYSKKTIAKIFSNSLLCYFGKISYGLYIFHWPIRLIAGAKFSEWGTAHFHDNETQVNFLSLCACLVLTFIISFISFNYFESYFLRLKK